MSNPAPSPVLRAIEQLRRLSAIALWFATLFGRILPGAGKRAQQAEAWRYIEATMTQFADLLERLAAGEIAPEQPKRATSRPRPASVPARPSPRANQRRERARSAPVPSNESPRLTPRARPYSSTRPSRVPPTPHLTGKVKILENETPNTPRKHTPISFRFSN